MAKVKKHNNVGQVMRSKGRGTRRRIIDQAMSLLLNAPGGQVAVADVARACELTPPAFYLYFGSVSDVVLAKLEEIQAEHHRYMDLAEKPWKDEELYDRAVEFVTAYVEYWDHHAAPLRYRNLMSDHGDERFMRMRTEMSRAIYELLVERITKSIRSGLIPVRLHAPAAATAALSLIDHVAVTANSPYGRWSKTKWDRQGYIEAAAYMLISLFKAAPR